MNEMEYGSVLQILRTSIGFVSAAGNNCMYLGKVILIVNHAA